ncbi:MAG: hypothetical protein JNJ54_25555 [Myxococcaceae bacterium]|nr:hypothetical protein [Myxococcaceae bacterium]
MAELLPIATYTRAAEQTIATLKKSPWIVLVPTAALGLGTLADWLLAPLLNIGIILAAPIKAILWSIALHVWRRTLTEGAVDRGEFEAELVARAKNLSMLAVPLLVGSVAFLTLAWGGALASLFVLAVVLTPLLEVSLLGSQSGFMGFLKRHAAPWALSQFLATSIMSAVWLVAVMIAAVVHVLAGEVTSALVGGPLITLVWLVRGHAYLALDAPEPPPPPPEPVKPAAAKKAPAAKPGATKGRPQAPKPADQKAAQAPVKPPASPGPKTK